MEREYLKGLGLEDEVIGKIMSEHGKGIQAAKGDLSTALTEVESYKEQLAQRDKDILALKDSSGSKKALEEQIAKMELDYKEEKETLQNKIAETKLNSALDLTLTQANVRNPKAVKALLELDKVKLTDNGLEGLDEQITALKEKESYLFGEVGKPPFVNGNNNSNGGGGTLTKQAIMEIKDTNERQKQITENRHLFQ